MATNYSQAGKVLKLTAPATVTAGTPYKIGSKIVIAAIDAASGAPFSAVTEGVFTVPKATGATWSEGQLLYWDDTAKKFTETNTSDTLAGYAVEAALTGDTTGVMYLDGGVRA